LTKLQKREVGNKEAIAQGVANILSGVSGMGGCAMLGQSLINVSNGAARPGIVAAIALLLLSCLVLV
jgi:SulP family sulfate permease